MRFTWYAFSPVYTLHHGEVTPSLFKIGHTGYNSGPSFSLLDEPLIAAFSTARTGAFNTVLFSSC